MAENNIQAEIDRILSLIATDDSVDRVFLFGSASRPVDLHEGSDIDLCIVQKTDLRFYDRLAAWIDRLEPRIGLDLVVYTPEEFRQLMKDRHFVRSEVVAKGKEVYAA